MNETLYRRPLPADAIAFSSPEGRQVFGEALAKGGLDGYFPLAEQFHTQAEPAFCGLGSLVVALNALGIDPGRLWKGPWRWFSEDLLDCCVPLDEVRERGLDIDELACLARCNGADVELQRADGATIAQRLDHAGWKRHPKKLQTLNRAGAAIDVVPTTDDDLLAGVTVLEDGFVLSVVGFDLAFIETDMIAIQEASRCPCHVSRC